MIHFILLVEFIKIIHSIDCLKFGHYCKECNDENCIACEDYYGIDTDSTSQNYKKCVPCKELNYYFPKCINCNSNYEICQYCEDEFGVDKDSDSDSYNTCIKCDSTIERFCYCNKDNKKCSKCKNNTGKDNEESTADNLICKPCNDDGCGNCFDDYKICKKCKERYGLHNNNCQPCISAPYCNDCYEDYEVCHDCHPLYYLYNGGCYICDQSCDGCKSYYKNCIKCRDGYGAISNQNGFLTCEKCPDYCEECKNSKCLKCSQGYGVNENGQCSKCQVNFCENCSMNYLICNECENLYSLNLDENSLTYGDCVNTTSNNCKILKNQKEKCGGCIDGYGLDKNNECVKCSIPNCKKCSKNYETCENCEYKTGLDTDINSITYGQCIPCRYDCLNCDASNAFLCLECPFGYGGIVGNCFKCTVDNCVHCHHNQPDRCIECDDYYYIHKETGYCFKIPIENCIRYDNDKCSKCINGYFNNHIKCIKKDILNCINYSINNNLLICEECIDGYSLSDDKRHCLKCTENGCIEEIMTESLEYDEQNKIKYSLEEKEKNELYMIIIPIIFAVLFLISLIVLIIITCIKKKKHTKNNSTSK